MVSSALNAYKSHDLAISMRTSTGDKIDLNFKNESNLSMASAKNANGSASSFSFSSLQAFSFKIETENGIDENDKKEIEELMKIAQPYIDNFMKNLEQGNQNSPISMLAHNIADIFGPYTKSQDSLKTLAQKSVVDLFDNAIQKVDINEKMIEEAQKLLEKILKSFEEQQKAIYA